MKLILTHAFIILFIFSCSKAKEIPKRERIYSETAHSPVAFEVFDPEDDVSFVSLPLRGDIRDQEHFWSGNFWPRNKGNINRRWNAKYRIGFNLRSPSRDEVLRWTPEQIAELAPSEKYDLLMGRYDYPLKKEVAKVAANEEAQIWEVISNGWALATLRHKEPKPITLVNPQGLEIRFGSEDIKGLLSYFYSYHDTPVILSSVGKSCSSRNCPDDLTAASFHIALANSLGIKERPFLMDIDRTRDVWNHPVVSFQSEYRGNAPIHTNVTPGTHTIVRMKTTVAYINEALNQTWEVAIGTSNQIETYQVYEYWLHLDLDGKIIGSEWKSNERPDSLWTTDQGSGFTGDFEGLNQLLNEV